MPRLLDRQEGDVDDPLVGLHVDPDERGGIPTDLLVDGQDRYAERRRQMREAHDGRPDPPPPAEAPKRIGRPPNSVRFNQTPVSQVDAGRTPSAPTLRAHVPPLAPGQPDWLPIGVVEFQAISLQPKSANPMAERAILLLQHHECLRLSIDGKQRESMRSALKTAAKRLGWSVSIKVGPGYIAVRRMTATDS